MPSMETSSAQHLKEVINELRMILDFLRDKELGERNRLNYLLADSAEMAQDVVDLVEVAKYLNRDSDFVPALDWLRKTKERMMNFGADGGETRPQSVGKEGDDEEEEIVVSLEEDVQQLVRRVIRQERDRALLTLCIKGLLGIGKTTLAKLVYNHAAVVGRFELRAWVCLSSEMSNKEVLMELIQQVVVSSGGLVRDSLLEKMDNRSLHQMLHQHLQGIQFFIVVDNWQKEFKFIFKNPMYEGNGSKILLTSIYFNDDVANYYHIHEMKPLDSDTSWQLFLKTIFYGNRFTSDEHKIPKHMERKGKEMLKKCGGLPVAIKEVARQKAKQRLSGIEWEELFDSIDLSASLKLLEPIYHKLDPHIKACFLHLSFFKENAIMRSEKLKQIWAAGGILKSRRYMSWTYDLFSESLIEVVGEYHNILLVKKFRTNPLVHMLSIKKAEDEMDFEILRCNGNNRPSQSPRHRVIHCSRDIFNHISNQDKHLVSLIFHGGGRYLDDAGPSYWESFQLLNILDLEDFGVKILSETIGTLIELRYLGLRNNYIQEIPHSFGGLKKLEVLDIALNFVVQVSDIIGEMGNLRHLYMSDMICQKPLNIDALQNLETLTYISIYDWTYDVSSLETTRLQKLGIEEVDENSDVSKLFASLAKLEGLYCLNLRGFRFRSMPCLDELRILGIYLLKLDGLLSRLPSANNFPQQIRHLILVNTCLDEDPMPVLEKLPDLYQLNLQNAYTGRQMVIQQHGFLSLRYLCITEMWNLRKVEVEEGAMSDLVQIEIKNCPHLETLPEEFGSMENLRKLKMVTTKHIATKIRNSGLISKILEVDISP